MTQQLNQAPSIETALNAVKSKSISDQEIDGYLDVLQDYECWQPLFKLLFRKLKDSTLRSTMDYIRLAKIYANYLEDIPKLADTCRDLIKFQKMSYQDFREEVLSQILLDEEFGKEATVLERIKDVLQSKSEKISCTERLCLIYEKKKYDEMGLNSSYEALIKLDANNAKALRYFKAVYTQNQSWEDVVDVLKRLYQSARHVNDGFRIAQELATVYLFQMDLPDQAIKVLDKYCQDSPLDTSSIKYEACYRLKNWSGCLEVLEEYLPKVESETNRAIIYLKIGELYELLGKQESALEAYQVSFESQPSILEPLENMIEIYIHNKNWGRVIDALNKMKSAVKLDHQIERIDEAVARIQGGLTA